MMYDSHIKPMVNYLQESQSMIDKTVKKERPKTKESTKRQAYFPGLKCQNKFSIAKNTAV